MNILVIGSGSIAKRHVSNLISLGCSPSVFSQFISGQEMEVDDLRVPIVENANSAGWDGVVIANSTDRHMDFALAHAEIGHPIFVEKPLSNTIDGVYDFLEIVDTKKLTVEAGFMLHAHKQVGQIKRYLADERIGNILYVRAAVGQWLPDWRPGRDYRDGYAVKRASGGGVLLDLIHEVELVQSLFGKIANTKIYSAKCPSLEIETEAIATVNGTLSNQAICHIEMDYVRRRYARELEIVGDEGSLYWNYFTNKLSLCLAGQADIVHELSAQESMRNNMYKEHMKHFISRINNPEIQALSEIRSSISALETVLGELDEPN